MTLNRGWMPNQVKTKIHKTWDSGKLLTVVHIFFLYWVVNKILNTDYDKCSAQNTSYYGDILCESLLFCDCGFYYIPFNCNKLEM